MGQVKEEKKPDRDSLIKKLRLKNPRARLDDIIMYVDSFLDYRKASENIVQFGSVVSHPRTGAPMDNPYLKVKITAMISMQKIKRVRFVDSIWE